MVCRADGTYDEEKAIPAFLEADPSFDLDAWEKRQVIAQSDVLNAFQAFMAARDSE